MGGVHGDDFGTFDMDGHVGFPVSWPP